MSSRRWMIWIVLCGAMPPVSAAQEWTRFRGPNGSGLSAAAAVPVRWSEQDYNWKVKLPGGGHSSPVLWGDRVFLISAQRESLKRFVLCVGARDGAILWQRTFDLAPYNEHEQNAIASSTPAVDQDHVYVSHYTSNHLSLIALTHEGRPVWECDLGAYKSLNGGASSPIVYKDFVILANDQESDEASCCLIAVDRRTGKTRWKLPRRRGDTAYATPCVYESANQAAELIFCGQAHGMTSVDPYTGKLNWELNGLFDKMVVASPVIASGFVIGTCGAVNGGNFLAAVRMTATGGRTVPEVAYKVRLSASYVPTPVVKGDLIFMLNDNGIVTCLRAATGKEVWRERIEGRGQYFGSPVCVNDRLYCISVEGDVVVLAASAKFQLLARNPLGEKSYATPAVADGRMYLRTYSHLISIGGGR